MQARATEYRGIVFRSKSEAQLAYILDHAEGNIVFDYEPVNFKTSSGYIPDFAKIQYVLNNEFRIGFPVYITIIEYKPSMPTDSYLKTLSENFAELYKKDSFKIIDSYLLIFGSAYNNEFNAMSFDPQTLKINKGYFKLNWITPKLIDEALNYRFDLKQ